MIHLKKIPDFILICFYFCFFIKTWTSSEHWSGSSWRKKTKLDFFFFFFANLQENAYKTHSAIHIYIPFLYSWCIQQARFFVEWHLHTYQVQHLKPSALSLDKAFLSLPTIWHSLPISVELERVSVKEKGAGIDFTLSSRLPYSTAVCAGIQTRAWVSSFLSLNEESGQCRGMILATDVY